MYSTLLFKIANDAHYYVYHIRNRHIMYKAEVRQEIYFIQYSYGLKLRDSIQVPLQYDITISGYQ